MVTRTRTMTIDECKICYSGRGVVEVSESIVGIIGIEVGAWSTHTREGSSKELASYDVYGSYRSCKHRMVWVPRVNQEWRCLFVLSPRFLDEMAWRPLIRACLPGRFKVVGSIHTHWVVHWPNGRSISVHLEVLDTVTINTNRQQWPHQTCATVDSNHLYRHYRR